MKELKRHMSVRIPEKIHKTLKRTSKKTTLEVSDVVRLILTHVNYVHFVNAICSSVKLDFDPNENRK